MATYVVTLKQGFGKTGKAKIENRTVRVVAPDSKSARQIAETAGWSAIQAVPTADSQKRRLSPFPRKPLIIMCKSLAAMLDAQIPLPKALDFYNAHLTREDLRLTLRS